MTERSPLAPLAAFALAGGISLTASSAAAGIPECRDLRLEDVVQGGCELRASASCSGGCSQLGIYNKACATKLHTVCREDCTLDAEPTCTDSCTVRCSADCDRGINVVCVHNCFGECVGSCDGQCEDADDVEQCTATCEATCDGECDIQCRPLVSGDCYRHCIECCDGSCSAQANMTCQTTCQEEEFTDCERELRVECDASCEVEGALFCDGEYMLSGADMLSCVQALVERGTLEASVAGEASIGIGDAETPAVSAGCSVGRPGLPARSAGLALSCLLGLCLFGRRRGR